MQVLLYRTTPKEGPDNGNNRYVLATRAMSCDPPSEADSEAAAAAKSLMFCWCSAVLILYARIRTTSSTDSLLSTGAP